MGPKAAPVAEAPKLRNGANLVYIRCALPGENQFVTVCMNLNCRVDIILDTAKKAMLAAVDAKILKVNAQLTEEITEGAEPPAFKPQEVLDRLAKISEGITAAREPDAPLELQDEAATAVGVKGLLSKNGTEALKPAHKYLFGVLVEGTFTAF